MKYLQLDYNIIEEKYPKSLQKIIEWFAARDDLRTYLKRENAEVDVIAAIKEMVPMIIQHDPRKLYEFFDQNNIQISIHIDNSGLFFVHKHSQSNYSDSKDDRIDAEQAAFLSAFEYLESASIG